MKLVRDLAVLHVSVLAMFGLLYFANDLRARFVSLGIEMHDKLTTDLIRLSTG